MSCFQHPDCNCAGVCNERQMLAAATAERLEANAAADAATFHVRAPQWAQSCFGGPAAYNLAERSHRFLEEALELAQATGTTEADALALVAYVYGRPAGDAAQEAGGTMLTLAILASAARVHLPLAAEAELKRVWLNLPRIRAKRAAAMPGSPLPGRLDPAAG